MFDMTINGAKMAEPGHRAFHYHTDIDDAVHSCLDVTYSTPNRSEGKFLAVTEGNGTRLLTTEFLFAIVNHYISIGWIMEHCDSTSAVLRSE